MESRSHGVGRYNLMSKGNKYSGRNSRRFSVGPMSLSGSDSCSNVSSSYNVPPRQTRTNSLSDNFPKFWLGGNFAHSEVESVVSDDTINNCDDICDTNDDEIETDEKENDRVDSRLMREISESREEEDCSVVSMEGEEADDDENNNLVLRDISNAPGNARRVTLVMWRLPPRHRPSHNIVTERYLSLLTERRGRRVPQALSLSQMSDLSVPSVVLTPDSPPHQHSPPARTVKTLYTPDQTKLETTIIERDDVFFPPESLEQEIQRSISNLSDDVIICGKNDTVSKSYIDIVPDLGNINLPFGNTKSISESGLSVTRSTTSVTQGKVHVVKDVGDGNISIATTTFCGVRHSVLSTTSNSQTKPNAR